MAQRRFKTPSLIAFALAAASLVAGFAQAASSAVPPTPRPTAASSAESIVELIVNRNPGLKSYVAAAHLDLRQVSFPYLHPVLDGHAYVLAPGYTTFDYPHTPFYLKGLTKFQGAFGDATRWPRCYDMTIVEQPSAYSLHMVPKIQGEIAFIDVLLGLDGAINHVEWHYRDNINDRLVLNQQYSTVDGHNVVTSQTSDVTLHHIRARGTQTFSSFEFNVPVPTPTPTPSDPAHACDN